MQNNRDEYEPIIATRRSREPPREDTQPLWRLVLALAGGLAIVGLVVWWLMGRSSSDGASTTVQTEESATVVHPEVYPETHVEQPTAPPATDSESNADFAPTPAPPASSAEPAASAEQAATPESIPEVAPDGAAQSSSPPTSVSVRFTSLDTQVRFELRGPLDSSPPLTINAGEVVDVSPGTYRVVASGPQMETLEREFTLTGERPAEYAVELCAQPKREFQSLAGQIVEERACASAAECESMFMVLSEHAEQLVRDRAFRTQQCAKWRSQATPDGRWTLDTRCGGATLAATCHIEITEGACTIAEPRRSVRGGACPRAELK